MKTKLDIRPSPRLLEVLGDIPLANWQCFSELIDNSLDELLKQPKRSNSDPLRIDINIETTSKGESFVVVRDNGGGMTEEELERSLRAGHSSKGRYGSLGLFGMGFNIATARLGNVTTVETTTVGSNELLSTTINFADLQRNETFEVPLIRTQCNPLISGTTVRILLKRAVSEDIQRPAAHQGIIKQLGDVYSYLLRDGVPGLNRDGFSSRIPAVLSFNGVPVEPVLPCIWSDNRTVISGGVEVHAVEYIDEKLTDATACLSCGYWDRKNGPEECDECRSQKLEKRVRRIWGWVGIQRYIDSGHFGLDFIRYGRKILSLDKSIFTYQDPDTLETDTEYPIEMPANQGRIVGEVHLDHVPVTYQKNDFDRLSRDWQTAINIIRGEGPLKPRRRETATNRSPLARLYSAFRRNDPGTRYLTPGDGDRAIHSKAKEWSQFFAKGIARYRDDTEWFDAASRHQRSRDGDATQLESGNSSPIEVPTGEIRDPAAGAVRSLLGVGVLTPTAPPRRQNPLSENELLAKARILGSRRTDLSANFNLSRGLGSWQVTVYTTKERLEDSPGQGLSPARHGVVSGRELEVFVCDEHPIFKEFGRDVRDVALLRVAEMIKGLVGSVLSVGAIYGELVQSLLDLKTSDTTIIERINSTFDRIRQLMFPFVVNSPEIFWEMLEAVDKAAVENKAAVKLPSVVLADIIDDARFIQFVAPDGLRKLVEKRPDEFFDGKVFRPSLQGRSADARARVISNVIRPISSLNDFQLDSLMRQKNDIALALISLDHLESNLSSEDFHS